MGKMIRQGLASIEGGEREREMVILISLFLTHGYLKPILTSGIAYLREEKKSLRPPTVTNL